MRKIGRLHEIRIRLASLGLLGLLFFSLTNTPVHADGEPDLTISKTHSGTFSPLDVGRTYAITVSNIGGSPTTGTVTVVDTLPDTLSATEISGDGWSCALATLTCTRSDALADGASYPEITLTVNVLVNAPSLITNQADVSGGGEVDFTNNTALDDTIVDAKPDLVITGYQLLNSDKSQVITQPNPNEIFWVRMTVENRGGEGTGNFYPGVFLDDKPNYGPDHDSSDNPGYPVTLTLGEVTDYQGYETTDPNPVQEAGCRYYDPGGLIDPDSIEVQTERGNYHPIAQLPGLAAESTTTVDVEIAYPAGEYPDPVYDNIREGLPAGPYRIYLYVDPVCNVDESIEGNNKYGPITEIIGDTSTQTYKSVGAQDGWILESTENSGKGGTKDNTSLTLYIGDDAGDKQYRSILSFNTAGLDDTAVITSVTLRLKRNGVVGSGNPINIFKGFMVDVRRGTFGPNSLALGDFKASSSITVGPFKPGLSGGWYNIVMTSAKDKINKAGYTQIRLRFKRPDNDNAVANILKIYSGNTTNNRPQLIIEYYVP